MQLKHHIFRSKSIFLQLVLYSCSISLFPILIISGYMFARLQNSMVKELNEYHSQILSQYAQNIEEKLEQYNKSLDFISNNTTIVNALENEDDNAYSKGKIISEEISKSLLLEESREIFNCMVYSMLEDNPVYGRSVSMLKEAELEGWYGQRQITEGVWFSYLINENKKPILSFIEPIETVDIRQFVTNQIGIVKLDVDLQQLFSPAALAGESEAAFDVIVYVEDDVLYSTFLEEDSRQLLEEYQNSYDNTAESEESQEIDRYVVKQTGLDTYGLKLLVLFANNEAVVRKQEIMLTIIPIILILISISLICAYIYSRFFSRRIENLLKKFKLAETGDLTIQNPVGGNDEIAELDRQFSHMLTKLDQLIKTNYIQRLENKETQLRNLQLQINPHFLYNTLETISSIAAVKQVFEVCDMCQKLGEIFRYNLGKDYGEYVTLQQELDHMSNYIFLQKVRLGQRLEVIYHIEVNGEKYKILRFILQPIVENAIVHGIGPMTGKGILEIEALEQEDALFIKIKDNGVGMGQEKVEQLQTYIDHMESKEDTTKSIGIRNVNQRIKLSWGNTYGIFIESHSGLGSCFTLRLPIIKEGDET